MSFTRYFKRELVLEGAINAQQLPKYFAAWTQRGSDQCIYSPQQLKRYKAPHLEAGCWYLDCHRGFAIDSEAEVKSLHDGGAVVVEDLVDATEDDDGQQDKSSAPPPKRGRRLKSLGSQSRASQQTHAESSVLGKGALVPYPAKVVSKPSPTSTTAPSSISASEITRGLIDQRKAKLFPPTTSSAGTPHSIHVNVSSSSVDSLLVRHKELSDMGGDLVWNKTLDSIRKV